MATTALQWMNREAKRIQKQHPRMAWSEAIKKSGAAYRAAQKTKKMSGTKKVGAYKIIESGETSRTKPKTYKNIRRSDGKFWHTVKPGAIRGVKESVAGLMSQARRILITQIGDLEGKKIMARTKTEKKSIQKEITKKKSQLRRILAD